MRGGRHRDRAGPTRLPIGSGYRYVVGSSALPIVAVSTVVAIAMSRPVGFGLLVIELFGVVVGVRATGVFGFVRGGEVGLSARVVGVRIWSETSIRSELMVTVVPSHNLPLVRARFGSAADSVVLHGCHPMSGQWARTLLPEYGHALLRLSGDTDYSAAVAAAIDQMGDT